MEEPLIEHHNNSMELVVSTPEKRDASKLMDSVNSNHNNDSTWKSKRFRKDWLQEESMKGWLQAIPHNEFICKCAPCDAILICGKAELEKHAQGTKHNENVRLFKTRPRIISTFETSTPISRPVRSTASYSTPPKNNSFVTTRSIATDAELSELRGASSSDDESIEYTKPKMRFKKEWLTHVDYRDWLRPVDGDKFSCKCVPCNFTMSCDLRYIKRHAKGAKHQQKVEDFMPDEPPVVVKQEPLPPPVEVQHFEPPPPPPIPAKPKKVKDAEIKLATYIGEHNLPTDFLDKLADFMSSVFSESRTLKDMQINADTTVQILNEVVYKSEIEKVIVDIQKAPFSLLISEQADTGSTKYVCLVVRYVSPHTGYLRVEFLEALSFTEADYSAENVASAIKTALSEKDIPLENLVGIGYDAEIIGITDESFKSFLLKELPDILIMNCLCNSSILIANNACKKLPHDPELLLNYIAYYISNDLRCSELIDLQNAFEVERQKLLHLPGTRWLALHKCISLVLENWDVLQQYFEVDAQEDNRETTAYILNQFGSLTTEAYLLFLKHALTYLNSVNELFISAEVELENFFDSIKDIFNGVCSNFLSKISFDVDLESRENYTSLDKVYLGPECEHLISRIPKVEVDEIRLHCREFYVVVATEIKKRLLYKEMLPVLLEMKFLSPDVALNFGGRNNLNDLALVGKHFRNHLDMSDLAVEWRALPYLLTDEEKNDLMKLKLEDVWYNITHMKGFNEKTQFPNLGKLSQLVLSLPFSNAETERIFSIQASAILNNEDKISRGAVNAVVLMKSNFKCENFDVTPAHISLYDNVLKV